jgi:hypothetical protein
MAVPTIASITPSSGPSWGGYVVEISGTNFVPGSTLEPTSPFDGTGFEVVPRLAVSIGGVACTEIAVESETKALVRVPEGRFTAADPAALTEDALRASYDPLDVVVQNLNEDGAAVAGEIATLAAGFTYYLPVLDDSAGYTPVMQVVAELVRRLRREVVAKTRITAHTDYGVDDATTIELSDHPQLQITVDEAEDREYAVEDPGRRVYETSPGSGVYVTHQAQRTVRLKVEMLFSANFPTVVERMCDAWCGSMLEQPWLVVDSDSRHPEHPFTNEYPLEETSPPETVRAVGSSNVFAKQCRFDIRGVVKLSEGVVATTYPRETISLIMGELDPA